MPPRSSASYESIGSTSSSLLERVKLRDEAAWQRLTQLYGRLVLYWCHQAGLQPADRSDVFQEVFRAVGQHIDDLRRDQPGQSFRGWFRTIVRSKIADHFRRVRREPGGLGGSDAYEQLQELSLPTEQTEPDGKLTEDIVLVTEAMRVVQSEFEQRTWLAFYRCAIDGVQAPMVATELGMTPDAVRKAKSRVLLRLRQELDELID